MSFHRTPNALPAEVDVEKSPAVQVSTTWSAQAEPHSTSSETFLKRWNGRIENLAGFEARGMARVQPDERQPPSTAGLVQMLLLWLSANVAIINLAAALTGPLVFQLGFLDSALLAVFGAILGSISTAYMSTWGAVSGNRTMVSRSRSARNVWYQGSLSFQGSCLGSH